jgi:hypothetical protein
MRITRSAHRPRDHALALSLLEGEGGPRRRAGREGLSCDFPLASRSSCTRLGLTLFADYRASTARLPLRLRYGLRSLGAQAHFGFVSASLRGQSCGRQLSQLVERLEKSPLTGGAVALEVREASKGGEMAEGVVLVTNQFALQCYVLTVPLGPNGFYQQLGVRIALTILGPQMAAQLMQLVGYGSSAVPEQNCLGEDSMLQGVAPAPSFPLCGLRTGGFLGVVLVGTPPCFGDWFRLGALCVGARLWLVERLGAAVIQWN